MKLRTNLATLFVASTLIHFGCGGDSGTDAGGNTGDGGGGGDAGISDTGAVTTGPGTKVGAVPATDIHVSNDGAEVLWLDGDGVLKAVPAGGGTVKNLTLVPDILGGRGTPTLWYWEAANDGTVDGELHSYRSGASATTLVASGSARGVFYISADGETAVSSENHRTMGNNHLVDLAVVKRDGTGKMTVMTGVNVGTYDMDEGELTGDCSPSGDYLDNTHAVVLACVGNATQRSIIYVDVGARTAREIAGTAGTQSGFQVGADGSYAIFLDAQGRLFGVSAAGGAPVALSETDPVYDAFPLSGKRFVYSTDTDPVHVRVGSFPYMRPAQLMADDIYQLWDVSPDGSKLLFSNDASADESSFSIELISTSTTPASAEIEINMATDAYPGDDRFSADGQYTYYFRDLSADFIGIALSAKTDGTGTPVNLAPATYYILNYSDPTSVLLMTNATVQNDYVKADLAVRKRDGSAALQTLVGGVNGDEFQLFPARDKIAFIVEEGGNAGIWVRSVP